MASRHDRGRRGEDLALRFLEGLGWTLLDRNWRAGHAELDLVVRLGTTIAFVEVKTRAYSGPESPGFDPLDSVTYRKRREVERASAAWVHLRPEALRGARTLRFDAVAVELVPGRPAKVRHLPDAWRPGQR
jgi:putative endonuclease